MLKGLGFINEEIANPFVGIICPHSEISPGHAALRQLAQAAKDGVRLAGGTPVEIGAAGICDGIALGHAGINFALASRELTADTVETVVGAYGLDAVLLIANCEKLVAGMLMGAARVNIPAMVVSGGAMPTGRTADMGTVYRALAAAKEGRAAGETLAALEEAACAGCGACAGVPNAHAMAFAAEALGMSMPGSATCQAGGAEIFRRAKQAGGKIMELLARNLKPSQIITPRALQNALAADAALGGSPATILHLRAVAHELGLTVSAETINAVMAVTPVLGRLSPADDWQVADLHAAGGIPAILQALAARGAVHADALAVTGRAVIPGGAAPWTRAPLAPAASLAVVTGNLAPEGAVVTWPGGPPPVVSGPARVFAGERAAAMALLEGRVAAGEVMVIRGEGPRGGPGMRELAAAPSPLAGHPLAEAVVMVTDGRFSGWRGGVTVQQASPEAAVGGPLAAVADGDVITVDALARTLTVNVTPEELARRLKGWTPPPAQGGYLGKYARLVSSAAAGAVTR